VRGDTELVTVILNSTTIESKFVDSIKLWDYGFENYYTYTAASAVETVTEVRVRRGEDRYVNASVAHDLDITLNTGYDSKNITTEVKALEEKVRAPLKKGDVVGQITYSVDGEVIGTSDITVTEDIGRIGYAELLSRMLASFAFSAPPDTKAD